jgi:protein-S-isoprenylcysteine O-methyltransferase Ste14
MVFIFGWLIPAIRKHVAHGIYAALGLGICFTAIILGNAWQLPNVYPLPIIASILSIFALLLFILSFTGLKHRGKPTKGWEDTTAMVGTGVYRVVQHPMYLAGALWAIACILAFKSIPLVILGATSFCCLWMASKKRG